VHITTAWQQISPQVIVKGFKKSCKSSAAVETDEDTLWNDSEEHGNVMCECEEDEGIDCEDGDSGTDWYS